MLIRRSFRNPYGYGVGDPSARRRGCGADLLTSCVARSRVLNYRRVGRDPDPVCKEATMSSTASLITVLASVAFGLLVIGIGTYLFGNRTA